MATDLEKSTAKALLQLPALTERIALFCVRCGSEKKASENLPAFLYSVLEEPPIARKELLSFRLSSKEAEELSLNLSDLLCWLSGFQAARAGTELEYETPMGVEAVRELNIKLKKVF